MSEVSEKVISTKNALMTALGENKQKYLTNMKMWFRHTWSKKKFDSESRKLLPQENIHLHNEFLLAILNKIDVFELPLSTSPLRQLPTTASVLGSGSSRSRKRKRTSRGTSDRVAFVPCDFFNFIPRRNKDSIQPTAGKESATAQVPLTTHYYTDEPYLPDAGFILGRFYIGAWESGLTTADDAVSECIVIAVQTLLKNIISSIIMNKKHYKVTGEGAFYYDVGAPLLDPSIRNTITRRKIDDAPLELDKEITSPNFMRRSNDDGSFLSACEEISGQRDDCITVKDVFLALGSDHNMLTSHWVYIANMERITQLIQ